MRVRNQPASRSRGCRCRVTMACLYVCMSGCCMVDSLTPSHNRSLREGIALRLLAVITSLTTPHHPAVGVRTSTLVLYRPVYTTRAPPLPARACRSPRQAWRDPPREKTDARRRWCWTGGGGAVTLRSGKPTPPTLPGTRTPAIATACVACNIISPGNP